MFKRFIFDSGKAGINPAKFISCVLILLLMTGIIGKWFLGLRDITEADLGILAVPVLGLILQVGWISAKKLQQ